MGLTRTAYLTTAFAAVLALSSGCAHSDAHSDAQSDAHPDQPAAAPASTAPAATPGNVVVSAVFAQTPEARNYDKALVPDGAKALVSEEVFDGSTTVTLNVRGLLPNRTYGAHAHAKPCGDTGEAAGSHFQHTADPVKPSVDPRYANPGNEIWLDFTTDAQGNATSARTVAWTFGPHPAGSVVIHAQGTQTAPGKAGVAGARAACLTVPFTS